MRGRGTDVFVHHSSVALEERRSAEERFHHGTDACIVCTSTLELGIDVGDLDLVFQENATSTVSSFLQRMGRTGRRPGTKTNTTFFCEDAVSVLQAVALIELAREHWVEPVPIQTRCWPVLVHQLFAMTLERGAITAAGAWEQLSKVPDFHGIRREEFGALIEHMKLKDFLFESGGQLSLGQRAERVFGRKNFMELYTVFSSPVMYRVQTAAGRDIGVLEQAYVDRLVEEITSFLLGGRAWTVEHVNHSDKTVRARPAPRGKKPSWGGYVPRHLGYELCQKMRDILCADEAPYQYLDHTAASMLEEIRGDLGPLLKADDPAIRRPLDCDCPVLCMDEPPVQLIRETRTPMPATRNRPRRVDYEYERAGTASVLMFCEPLSGWRQATSPPTPHEKRLGRGGRRAARGPLRSVLPGRCGLRQPQHAHQRRFLRTV